MSKYAYGLCAMAFIALAPMATNASTEVTGVSINGNPCTDSVLCYEATPGEIVSIDVSVKLTSGSDWESTSSNWYTDGVGSVCHNTSDTQTLFGTTNVTKSFNQDVPTSEDTFDLAVSPFGTQSNFSDDDNCSTGADDTLYLNGILMVKIPVTEEQMCVLAGNTWFEGACYTSQGQGGSTDPSPFEWYFANGYTMCWGNWCTKEEAEKLMWESVYGND